MASSSTSKSQISNQLIVLNNFEIKSFENGFRPDSVSGSSVFLTLTLKFS